MCLSFPDAGELALAFGATFAVGSAANAAVGGAIYVLTERKSRWRWWDVPAGVQAAAPPAGPFRGGGEVPVFHGRAPADLRWTSYLAITLGLWALPLVPVALILLAVVGAGVLLGPTIVAGIWLFSAGRGLLLRRPGAARSALGAAQLLQWVSIVHLVVTPVLTIATDSCPLVAIPYMLPYALGLALSRQVRRTVRHHFPATI